MKEKSASENFLARWSRRKQQSEVLTNHAVENSPDVEPSEPAVAKDPAELPIWQRDDVDPETRQQALRDLFRKPGFNKTDGLEEYENDYNYHAFAGLGSVVTHEMKRMLERQLEADETAEPSTTADSTENPLQDEDAKPRNTRDEED
ncbi:MULTISPECIES: DUF3306 domain-containing protein [unclassified Methylophaga]|jgi:hypothetical protein|uniref:DUF3306 domain-containing protein n=1 Tax=unclassified Methylophaga TaxID=2629249 RepID=UPI000C93C64D|nr:MULTISPECIES: DUF3306 domain-containing protein [unclassified Methylophaga]MAK67858.1 hypothetical protein [Methylophaga sp.]MAY18541.1 hypothetical protein [Methylophaga sp.]MBN45833.1 hypothetical protein [Methylophaga sp.]HAO23906.1 hypothetical protein [Methylophaga sp.]HCD06094.1 hypothetical protein [Methylophaga sp.]|tara:strand:- start:5347 stop:5787 length:441 start_codon:yes stop_codon:yes gene_type:complete